MGDDAAEIEQIKKMYLGMAVRQRALDSLESHVDSYLRRGETPRYFLIPCQWPGAQHLYRSEYLYSNAEIFTIRGEEITFWMPSCHYETEHWGRVAQFIPYVEKVIGRRLYRYGHGGHDGLIHDLLRKYLGPDIWQDPDLLKQQYAAIDAASVYASSYTTYIDLRLLIRSLPPRARCRFCRKKKAAVLIDKDCCRWDYTCRRARIRERSLKSRERRKQCEITKRAREHRKKEWHSIRRGKRLLREVQALLKKGAEGIPCPEVSKSRNEGSTQAKTSPDT